MPSNVVTSGADVLAELPRPIQLPTVAPVRDALCEALASGFKEHEIRAEFAAAQCDPLGATGDALKSIAKARGIIPGKAETEDSIKSRLFAAPLIVTPDAVRDQIDTILSPYTDKRCSVCEIELDGYYVHDGGAWAWDSFVGVNPRYPDRIYYDDRAENGGVYATGNDPGGAIPGTGLMRSFLVRIPALSGDENVSYAIDASDEIMPISDGSDTAGSESDGTDTTFIFVDYETDDEVYDSIVGLVESIKGQGMSWTLYVDPEI